jgi:hypothetical protein
MKLTEIFFIIKMSNSRCFDNSLFFQGVGLLVLRSIDAVERMS